MVLAHLAATGRQDRVTAAQPRRHGPGLGAGRHGLGADGRGVGEGLDGEVPEEGVPGRRPAVVEVFAWLRPNDLVWNYWVNNYLQGKPPPNFDILYWNADATRMSAALHRDFIDIAMGNSLIEPGKATMLGTPVDLSKVTVDSYVTAGIADHLCPWQACYRTTQLLGGESRFILSTSGHIASLVNPPGNPKSTFQVAGSTPADPEEWLGQARDA